MKIRINLNNKNRIFEIEPGETLLEVLRRNGVTSVKHGCDTGSCGACTVLLDNKPILSCTYLAANADGHSIITTEGIPDKVKEFADFLTAEGAEQCGFCGPALALTVIAMTNEIKNPDEEEIKTYLAGNLCRCSGYVGQLRAIKKYLGYFRISSEE